MGLEEINDVLRQKIFPAFLNELQECITNDTDATSTRDNFFKQINEQLEPLIKNEMTEF